MERVEGNADRQKDVEVRWMIDDADAGEEPLEIFQQEVSVFEKPEHAQVHADTGNQPCATRGSVFRFCNLPAQPKIHRGSGKKERGKRWIPGAVKNVARGHQQILSRIPGADAPVQRHYDGEEDNEGEGIEEHGRPAIAYLRRQDVGQNFVSGLLKNCPHCRLRVHLSQRERMGEEAGTWHFEVERFLLPGGEGQDQGFQQSVSVFVRAGGKQKVYW